MRQPRFQLLLLLSAALALPGCVYGRYTGDVEENPVIDTGVGAAVIMPGQSAPVMIPGGGYAPGGNTECRSGPNGQSCTSGGGTVAPSPSHITMIGGAEQDIENHMQAKENPLLLKWLTTPFAVLAAPFAAAAEAARGEPETGPAVPQEKTPRPEAKAPEVPEDYEAQRLQQMEDELDQKLAAGRRGSAPRATATQPLRESSSGAISIADELAALQRRPRTREVRRQAAPTPHETPDPRRAPDEADAADGIVDRNEDGRIDLWIYRQDGEIVRKVLDQNFDGQPDTTLHYDPQTHQLARVEEDNDHDGVTDGWTDYVDGKIARRRADANRDGTTDTWTFYRDGEIQRHEQDTDGDGFRDRVGIYLRGKLLREEQDSNADGIADVISHYDNGRLARKELMGEPDPVVP